ncbi:MAG: 50S ribosomal protein L21 [Candidatus Omnitrophota bacterium]|nr:50S ribosomal protein L21 [Candidatus Omnitrophota bacterium]
MAAYAIVETGAKQYYVELNSILEVEKLKLEDQQKEVCLDRVLFYKDGEKTEIGKPTVEGAQVVCEFLGNTKLKKVISFKFRRRKDSRRKHGHRQEATKLLVKEIKV